VSDQDEVWRESDTARELGRTRKGEAALPSGNGHSTRDEKGPGKGGLEAEEVEGNNIPFALLVAANVTTPTGSVYTVHGGAIESIQ
jgi:hypothetical protein